MLDDTKAAVEELDDPLMHGGDAPESQYQALEPGHKGVRLARRRATRVLLATDAPFTTRKLNPLSRARADCVFSPICRSKVSSSLAYRVVTT